MKDKVIRFLKPGVTSVVLTLAYITWQFYYSYRRDNFEFFVKAREYLGAGIGLINWNNFIIRFFSLGLIWIGVSLGIFVIVYCFEWVRTKIHNSWVANSFVNKEEGDLGHQIKYREIIFKRHFPKYLYFVLALMVIYLGFIYASDFLEAIRAGRLDAYFWALIDSGMEVDFEATLPIAISFVACIPIWYLYSSIAKFLFRLAREAGKDEKMLEEHYGAVIDS